MGQFEQVPIPLIEHPFLDLFVPQELRGTGSLVELRARALTLSAAALIIWAPVFGVFYLVHGHTLLACILFGAGFVVGPVPFVFQWTGSFAIAGNILSGTLWLVLVLVAFFAGGIQSPGLVWLPIVPILTYLFGAQRSFRFWFLAILLTVAVFVGAELSGFDFASILSASTMIWLWGLSLIGFFALMAQLFIFNSGIQVWLSIQVSEREDARMEVEEDLKQAQQLALKRSEESIRGLMERSPDGVVVYRNGRIVYTNPAFRNIVGYAQLQGLMLESLVAEDERSNLVDLLHRIHSGEHVPYEELRLVHDGGERVVVEATGVSGVFEGQDADYCLIRDITERKRLQGKMMQIDRMNAVGTLAAGVAHEINNPLAYVHSNAEYLLTMTTKYRQPGGGGTRDMLSLDELAEALEDIREGTDRIRSIVSDLSTFSKPEQQTTRPLDVVEVLQSALKMAENQLRHRARIVNDLRDVPAVEASEANLAQVFLNLLVNAAHAIPEGATEENEVTIKTSFEAAGRGAAGGRVVVEVSDTGSGIPEEMRGRIFDPFFSTKGQEEGMGLGLFICRNIMRDHGGDISFESSPGVGTTFRVELAAVQSPAEPSREFESPVVKDGLIGRALIIDDESGVCRTIERVLRGSYATTSVTSGREALELLRRDHSFAVIICDLLMPDISGVEVHEHISQNYPRLEQRMVFVTGGTFTELTNDFVTSSSRPVMLKPFDIKEFREVVDAVAQS